MASSLFGPSAAEVEAAIRAQQDQAFNQAQTAFRPGVYAAMAAGEGIGNAFNRALSRGRQTADPRILQAQALEAVKQEVAGMPASDPRVQAHVVNRLQQLGQFDAAMAAQAEFDKLNHARLQNQSLGLDIAGKQMEQAGGQAVKDIRKSAAGARAWHEVTTFLPGLPQDQQEQAARELATLIANPPRTTTTRYNSRTKQDETVVRPMPLREMEAQVFPRYRTPSAAPAAGSAPPSNPPSVPAAPVPSPQAAASSPAPAQAIPLGKGPQSQLSVSKPSVPFVPEGINVKNVAARNFTLAPERGIAAANASEATKMREGGRKFIPLFRQAIDALNELGYQIAKRGPSAQVGIPAIKLGPAFSTPALAYTSTDAAVILGKAKLLGGALNNLKLGGSQLTGIESEVLMGEIEKTLPIFGNNAKVDSFSTGPSINALQSLYGALMRYGQDNATAFGVQIPTPRFFLDPSYKR